MDFSFFLVNIYSKKTTCTSDNLLVSVCVFTNYNSKEGDSMGFSEEQVRQTLDWDGLIRDYPALSSGLDQMTF